MTESQEIPNSSPKQEELLTRDTSLGLLQQVFGADLLTKEIFEKQCHLDKLGHKDIENMIHHFDQYFESCPLEDLGIYIGRGRSSDKSASFVRSISNSFKRVFSRGRPREVQSTTTSFTSPTLTYPSMPFMDSMKLKEATPSVIVELDPNSCDISIPRTPSEPKVFALLKEEVENISKRLTRVEDLLLEVRLTQDQILQKLN
jgi:hypothetical protein